jgi:hypothetical protein
MAPVERLIRTGTVYEEKSSNLFRSKVRQLYLDFRIKPVKSSRPGVQIILRLYIINLIYARESRNMK